MTIPEDTSYIDMWFALDYSAKSYLKEWRKLRNSRENNLRVFGEELSDVLTQLYTDEYTEWAIADHIDHMIDCRKEGF